MEKFILIGVPGSGKTTLGEAVAERLELPFIDTDKVALESLELEGPIEFLRFRTKIRFHNAQIKVIEQLKDHVGSAIIATGPEVALMPKCISILEEIGTIIYIERSAKDIIKEVEEKERTQLHIVIHAFGGKDDDSFVEKSASVEAVKLYAKEDPQYKAVADVILNNDASEEEGVNELASIIERLIRMNGGVMLKDF